MHLHPHFARALAEDVGRDRRAAARAHRLAALARRRAGAPRGVDHTAPIGVDHTAPIGVDPTPAQAPAGGTPR